MQMWLTLVLTAVGSIAASSGFWGYIQYRTQSKTVTSRLLLGLAYDKIVERGLWYIERGSITRDEYEEFVTYLYQPYKDCGGNGVAERIMGDVSQLPFRSPTRYSEIPDRIGYDEG